MQVVLELHQRELVRATRRACGSRRSVRVLPELITEDPDQDAPAACAVEQAEALSVKVRRTSTF